MAVSAALALFFGKEDRGGALACKRELCVGPLPSESDNALSCFPLRPSVLPAARKLLHYC